jgi:hypothetical protein
MGASGIYRSMGRQIVMLRGKRTGQLGTTGIGGSGHWQLLCRRFGREVTAFELVSRMNLVGVKFVSIIGESSR